MTEIKQLISVENDNLLNIKIDQTVICDGKFYSEVDSTYKEKSDDKKVTHTEPNPLMYYSITEDSDYSSILSKLENIVHKSCNIKGADKYTDDDAETQYLLSEPISYIVLGKPEIGQVEIAKMLSDTWNCVNINPMTLISEEVNSESRAGKCIAYNLEAGRAVEPEIILRLVEKRVKSQTAQHRGFIINGFPLVPNSNYKEDLISSEFAVFHVQDIFEDLLSTEVFARNTSFTSIARQVSNVDEENSTELEDELEKDSVVVTKKKLKFTPQVKKTSLKNDPIDLGPSDMNIVIKSDKYHDLACPKKQMEFIFKLFENKPLVIIYIICDNIDVVNKRSNYRFDILKAGEFSINLSQHEIIDYYPILNKIKFKDDTDIVSFMNAEIDGTKMKHIVKLPHHFKETVSSQLLQYKCIVKSVIDNEVLKCNSEYFIKCDGRLSSQNMFNHVQTKLSSLGFQPVLIPMRINENINNLNEEDEEEQEGEFHKTSEDAKTPVSQEKLFKTLRINQQCGSFYKYGLSNWRFKCPVSLKEGRIVNGKTEFAVKFMSKIYFLSSEDTLNRFCKNPRPFLLPTIPNPTCRIWIFGPQHSQKSAIAECLSFLFDCKILDLYELEKNFEASKYFEYIEKIRTAAMTEALVSINNKRKLEREETIEEWMNEARNLLIEILNLLQSGGTTASIVYSDSEGDLFFDNIEMYEHKLKSLNLPPFSERDKFSSLINDKIELEKYLPEIFSRPIKSATVFDQFVKNYVKNTITNANIPDMTLSFDDKVDMIKNVIQDTEDEYYQINKTRGGWIIDGMFTDIKLLKKLCPEYLADDIICIKDESPGHTFLMTKFLNKEYLSTNDLSIFFNKMKKYAIADKISKDNYVGSNLRLKFIDNLLDDLQNRVHTNANPIYNVSNKMNDLSKGFAKNYLNSLIQFDEQWGQIKLYLEYAHKASIIEINIENKNIQDLLKEVVIKIENKYRMLAYAMTSEDREEEMMDYGGEKFHLESVEDEVLGEEADTAPLLQYDKFQANRRLGNTGIYCPVVFDRYFVLWEGNELYTASFAQSVYYLSSENALNEFIADPRIFLESEAPKKLPPPRICIIGTSGSGKTTCAKVLADNFGLHYVNFDHLILQYFNLPLENLNYIIEMDPKLDVDMQTNVDKLHILKLYIERDLPLSKDIIKKIISPLWFQEPYVNVGFVLDNFPRRPSDVECMKENYFIPDIVIELFVGQVVAVQRKFPLLLAKRKQEIKKDNQISREEHEVKFNLWQENRYLRLQILLEEFRKKYQKQVTELQSTRKLTTPIDSRDTLSIDFIPEQETETELEQEEYKHVIEYDEFQKKKDFAEANEILDKEMPIPVLQLHVPSETEISESIRAMMDADYFRDTNFFENVKVQLHEYNIKYTTVITTYKTVEKVFYEVLRLTDHIKFRNLSLFERCYNIDIVIAQKLLNQGYYFMSKFGRTCPVQVYENQNPIQMYLQANQYNIYPLIYRRYIYFLHTEKNLDKFINDPIKYTRTNEDRHFTLLPARIAIIGPPKAGKSTLAQRLGKEFNFKIITRGSAIRHILEYFPQSHLAQNIIKVLKLGWSVTYEMAAKAVEAITLHEKSITHGYILDGFPQSDEEMKQFILLGIVPHIILDVSVTKKTIYDNLATIVTSEPFRTYSEKFINGIYHNWERQAYDFREWLYKKYQNIKMVENKKCKWFLLERAKSNVMSTMIKFQNYLYQKNFDIAISLTPLCITPEEFFARQSVFRNFCPICWYYFNILVDGGPSPDRRNVIQYLTSFYFVCNKHHSIFIMQPFKYVPPKNTKLLPEDLPVVVNHNRKNSYYEDGFCIPCFWKNKQRRILKKGKLDYIITYKDNYYCFCSEKCMTSFFRTPKTFNNVKINFRNKQPVNLGKFSKLPTLGYLEQLVEKLVVDAVINTEIERPYLPGLTVAQSAALHMGLYLKINNPKASKESVRIYKEAKEKYDYRREKLKRKIEHFKSKLNPFVCVDNMRTERYKYSRIYSEDDEEYEVTGKPPSYSEIMYDFDHDFNYFLYGGEGDME